MSKRNYFFATNFLVLAPLCQAAIQDNLNITSVITIGNGDSITNSTVSGTLNLNNGATTSSIIVENGGIFAINNGAVADTTHVQQGGTQSIAGIATNSDVEGRQNVSGTATNTNINGGSQAVFGTGNVNNTVLNNGGQQYLLGTATDTTVNHGSHQQVQNGGIARNTTVNNGGWLEILSGGTSEDAVINQGGAQNIDAGASARNTVLHTGASQYVAGSADGTNVDGGTQSVAGTVSNTVLNNGGQQYLLGTATDTTVNNGSRQQVQNGGIARNTTINNGGLQQILSGGTSENTIINHGGTLQVAHGITLTGTTTLNNAGTISFAPPTGNQFIPQTLTMTNLAGSNGVINMSIRLDNAAFETDMLIIDGGRATGRTLLHFTDAGSKGLGLATTGNGIKVVDAINGATTDAGAFALARKLQAGAYNYSLNRGSVDENWYISSDAGYRDEVSLYSSLYAMSMDYDRALAGTYSQRSQAISEHGFWGRIQGGHSGHSDNGGIAKGYTPKSSGSYGFTQLGSDLLNLDNGSHSLKSGIYIAAGQSLTDSKNEDLSSAGKVRDTVYSFGGYLTAIHSRSGLWTDMVAQSSRHSLKANSDSNSFNTTGIGWLASAEAGLPFNVSQSLVLEPQLQYIWQGLSLKNGSDNSAYVNFDDGRAQHARIGIRFGNQSEMKFGESTSTAPGFTGNAKHRASELPVNWWVRPSVIRTFNSNGNMSMGTATIGSNVSFTPSQDGTSLDLQTGINALVRQNVVLGVQGGYTRNVNGSSSEGYNAQAMLKVSF